MWGGGKGGDNFKVLPIAITGKTTMLVGLSDAYHKEKGKKGYFACVMVPPSLTKKWPEEIKEIIPDANVLVINNTSELIEYHVKWTNAGRPKPLKPTYFVISFTTMRGDCAINPVTDFIKIKTEKQTLANEQPYRYGYYCPDCGNAHQVVESSDVKVNEKGEEEIVRNKRSMGPGEFGETRRIHNAQKPANAFCSECGSSLWTKDVLTRYSSFGEWAKHEKKLSNALVDGNQPLAKNIQNNQPDVPKATGRPRRIATVEYIRRRMNNFFDIALVDEIHELKSGMSAQGNSLGSLAAASKKVVGGTGTLFGGKVRP